MLDELPLKMKRKSKTPVSSLLFMVNGQSKLLPDVASSVREAILLVQATAQHIHTAVAILSQKT